VPSSASSDRRALLAIFAAFSTFQLGLLRMIDRGDLLLAVAYGTASLIAGFAGVMLGTATVRRARLTW
jgi:fluoride ion exporter CrcB/FEX